MFSIVSKDGTADYSKYYFKVKKGLLYFDSKSPICKDHFIFCNTRHNTIA